MDIEIIEEKAINHMKSFKNGIVSIGELTKFVKNTAIRNRESYFTDMNKYRELLESMLDDVYQAGYCKGIRENENRERKQEVSQNWDRNKVYPKGSIAD